MPGIESEARLEAEYLVRKFTVSFVEQIRSVVNEASNSMIPSLDTLMKEAGYGGVLEDASDSRPSIGPARGRSKSSSKR